MTASNPPSRFFLERWQAIIHARRLTYASPELVFVIHHANGAFEVRTQSTVPNVPDARTIFEVANDGSRNVLREPKPSNPRWMIPHDISRDKWDGAKRRGRFAKDIRPERREVRTIV